MEDTMIMKAAPLVWAGRYSTKFWRCTGQKGRGRGRCAQFGVVVREFCRDADLPW